MQKRSSKSGVRMNKRMVVTILFLATTLLPGCSTLESLRTWVLDLQRPGGDEESQKCKEKFEEGRRAECRGNIQIAIEKYESIINDYRGNRYGRYGLAKLLLRFYPDDETDAVKQLKSCAKSSSGAGAYRPDSAMDSAFSAAAMAELADMAETEHGRLDIADSLRRNISKILTEGVKGWANTMKANAASAEIYKDVIAAVESDYKYEGYAKDPVWDEIEDVLINGNQPCDMTEGRKPKHSTMRLYNVVRFVKSNDTGDECRYDYAVQLSGGDVLEVIEKVQSVLRRQLVKEFRAAHPSFSVDDVGISFPPWNHSGVIITGSVVAKVLKMSVVLLEYSDETNSGKITVRLGDRDQEAAIKFAIENIEVLAARHNIVNVVGKRPPKGARYTVGTLPPPSKDGLLEIEFKCK